MTDDESAAILFRRLAQAVDIALETQAKAKPVDNPATAGQVAVATVFGALACLGYVMYKERQ